MFGQAVIKVSFNNLRYCRNEFNLIVRRDKHLLLLYILGKNTGRTARLTDVKYYTRLCIETKGTRIYCLGQYSEIVLIRI